MHWSHSDLHRMSCNLKRINFELHRIARHLVSNKLDLLRIACNLKWINFVLLQIARHLIWIKTDLLRMACNLKRINFELHRIARNLIWIKIDSLRMAYNLMWINFFLLRIAGYFVSNKLDSHFISCDLIKNTICPTKISRSKTSRRTGADRKRESIWGCGMGIIKQRLILPAFWWCSDRRPSRCMKRESGESPEQCPLL